MNKIFFITFVAISVLLSFNATAQEKKEQRHFDREAFEARRNAFITAEVGLTPEEAAQFIPLCNELRQKKFEVGRECRKLSKEIRHKENPTDADYNKVIDECLDVEIKEAQLEKEYFERFKKILSPEKVYKYRNAKNRKSKILSLFVFFV
jgi:Spy/CpxP family protein refolding chaperone